MFRTYILNFALRISGEKKTVNKVRFVFYCQLVQAIMPLNGIRLCKKVLAFEDFKVRS
jgi:hypothetical protein